ncbi:MAG: aminopeptidase N [Actinomycetota bacterium]
MSSDNLTRDEARERSRLLSDARYRITLDLTRDDATFPSETVVRFRCSEPGASSFIDFSGSVLAAELNGAALPDDAADGNRIRLDGLAGENELRVQALAVDHRTGKGFTRFTDPVDGEVYVHTDLEPFDAHRAFPSFDQPDIKGVFDFTVLAPPGWEVVSNSPAEAPVEEVGRTRWSFLPTPPVPAYITAVVGGPFHVVRDHYRDIELGLYCRRSLAEHLDHGEMFEITKQSFEFFERVFEYPYPFAKYDQVFVPEYTAGAMENAGCVTFNETRYIFRAKVTDAAREWRAGTVTHEMAHMWFGDLVTMRWWDDLWLNESFASYMGELATAEATRFKNAWSSFASYQKTWAYQQDQLPTTHPISANVVDTQSIHLNFDGITYAKGASVLKQLVAWVGRERFLEGTSRYFRRHEWANAELTDFLAALEEVSGRDLGAWSKEWLETAGVNTLRPELEEGEGRKIRSAAILQDAPPDHPTLRSHRVAVGLYDRTDRGLVRRRRVELDVRGKRTEVPELAGERWPDLLLVNDDDLAYAKIRFDEHSWATIAERLGEIGESLPRALCWTAAWDMTRDAELPARDYLALVLRHAEREADISVLQTLLGQAASAVSVYGDPANREPALTALAEGSLEALRRTEPGSDHQLAWARSFISAATSDEQVDAVRDLLDGSLSFDGLAVDTDLRWHIVASLAAAGAADAGLIDAELERDPTDQGRRHAAAARAARATPEAKEEAWRTVTEDTSLALAAAEDVMAGFQQPGQRELLEPFAQRYFEDLPRVWESRELPAALAFAENLYPRLVVGPEVVEATDRYLAGPGVPGPVRRLLLEGKDGMERALRARAADRSSA